MQNAAKKSHLDEAIEMAEKTGQQEMLALLLKAREEVTALEALAGTDALTGLLNRHGWEGVTSRMSDDTDIAVILVDIDHFKQVNDVHGHAAGDAVLKAVAGSIRRGSDFLATRWGGEEMLIALPGTGLAGAHAVAERLRQALQSVRVKTPDGKEIRVTASFGVAKAGTPTHLAWAIERADEALYAAKRNGRNQVVVWEDNTPRHAA